jgi:hypothetical protein
MYIRFRAGKARSLKGIRFAAPAENNRKDFVNGDGRDDEIGCFLERTGEERGIGTICEILESARRIDSFEKPFHL